MEITGEAARDKFVRKLTQKESARDNPNTTFRNQISKKSSSQTNAAYLKQKQKDLTSKVESNRNIELGSAAPRKQKGPGANLKNES